MYRIPFLLMLLMMHIVDAVGITHDEDVIFTYVECFAHHSSRVHTDFCQYMKLHDKTYSNGNWREKLSAWKESVAFVRSHNAKDGIEYELALNHMADMTHNEYLKRLTLPIRTQKSKEKRVKEMTIEELSEKYPPPSSYDWRDHSDMSPVATQGDCGSCFAIVAAEMIDWWNNKLQPTRHSTSSVQQLMDCSSDEFPADAERCSGSVMEFPLRYARQHRVWHEHDYPYEERGDLCKKEFPTYKTIHPVNMHHTDRYSENVEKSLTSYIYHYGPVGVSFDASDRKFQHLGSGIYSPSHCSETDVNHALLVVGYTPDYYILKNSWGVSYGVDGYFKLKRGSKICGLYEVVSVILSANLK